MTEEPFSEWVRERPESIQRLMIDWPPEARVRAREGEVLMVPAPGVEGTVASWFEDGTIGVLADLPAGTQLRGQCDPTKLEIVGFATFGETLIDHDWIRSIVEPQRTVADGILNRHGESRATLEEAGLDDLPSNDEG